MKQHNEKFESHLRERIAQSSGVKVNDRHGLILSYNATKNTATVALTGQDSDFITDLLKEVPCPTYMGLQVAAPEPGRGCWVAFKGGHESQPMITHFYNHDYEKFDYRKMSSAKNDIPRYLTM
jgi:hypothetical protein